MQDNFDELKKGNDETQRLILSISSLIKSSIQESPKNQEKENEEYHKENGADNPESLSVSVNETTNHLAAASQEKRENKRNMSGIQKSTGSFIMNIKMEYWGMGKNVKMIFVH